MAIAPAVLEAGALEETATAGAVRTSSRMPRQPGYLTRSQVGQLNSDRAEYEDMKRQEAGPGPRKSSGRSAGRSSRSRASSVTRTVTRTARAVSGGSRRRSVVVRLIYGALAGFVVLEVASMATGIPFNFKFPASGKAINPPKPYVPLYTGQPVAGTEASQAAAAAAGVRSGTIAGAGNPSTVGQRMSALAGVGIKTSSGPLP